MKTKFGVCLCLAFAVPALAQPPGTLPTNQTAPVLPDSDDAPLRTADQLEQLVGPIALYPDALIALILPASAAPVDIVLAARFIKEGGDPNSTSSRAWDESVKSLAHYPDVMKWMDDNIEWTKQLGDAFLRQPSDVMKAVQRLRERARAAGTLNDTPQQVVGYDNGAITIVPAQPDVIYVPRYEPDLVYGWAPNYYSQPFLTFGVGYAVGPWLTHDCDWRADRIWVVSHRWNWRDHRDWRHPVFPGQSGYVGTPNYRPWTPPAHTVRPNPVVWRGREIVRPNPIAGAPVQTFNAQANSPATPATAQPITRRQTFTRRPANVVVQNSPQVAPEQAPQSSAPTIQMRPRIDPNNPERRYRPNPAVAVNRPATATPPPAAQEQRSFPFSPPPSSPVVAPITGPVVEPFRGRVVSPLPQQSPPPHPQIAFPSANNSPAPVMHMPPPAQHSAPPPAAHHSPPPAPAPAPQPQSQPAPREDRGDGRKQAN